MSTRILTLIFAACVSATGLAIPNPAVMEVVHQLKLNSHTITKIVPCKPAPNAGPVAEINGLFTTLQINGYLKNAKPIFRTRAEAKIVLSFEGRPVYQKSVPVTSLVTPLSMGRDSPQAAYNLTIDPTKIRAINHSGDLKIQVYVSGYDLEASAHSYVNMPYQPAPTFIVAR